MMDAQHLLLHPVRLRIVNAILDGRHFTTAQLGQRLTDVSKATIYRQLALLVAGDLIQVVDEERVRGGIRRTYQLTSRRPLLHDDDVSQLTADHHRDLMSNLATTMVAEFSRYLSRPDAQPTATSYRQYALWLTDDERKRLSQDLSEVIERYARQTPDHERHLHMLTAVLFPTSA